MSQTPAPTAAPFTLSSAAFRAGGSIPRTYTCDGRDVSPPLAWLGVPAGTAELALLVDDPDAHDFVHWVAAGIQPATTGLPEAASGTSGVGVEGRNGFGRTGWGGPCPPSGTHRYRFRLYAASHPLGLNDGATADQLRAALKDRTLATAELVATYHRG
jgi:Raf kinase inhibitor-like YbhB/YbcL family protein